MTVSRPVPLLPASVESLAKRLFQTSSRHGRKAQEKAIDILRLWPSLTWARGIRSGHEPGESGRAISPWCAELLEYDSHERNDDERQEMDSEPVELVVNHPSQELECSWNGSWHCRLEKR